MNLKIAAATAASLMFAAAPAFAQQGTTLAGPAQGQKADGSNSTQPSGASGANGATSGTSNGVSTGLGDSRTTATGGDAGGSAGRN